MRLSILSLLALFCATLPTVPTVAASCEPDLSGRQQTVTSTKCMGFFVEGKLPKNATPPKKLAIAVFQVRYSLRPAGAPVQMLDYGDSRFSVDGSATNFFELTPADYDRITEELYDEFVASLAKAGIEVADPEAVIAAPTYEKLVPDDGEMFRQGKFARATAYGLKKLKPRPLQYKLDRMGRVTKRLGVDATITVFLTVGLVPRPDAPAGTYTLGLRGEDTSPMEIFVLGGFKDAPVPGGGVDQVPAWMMRTGILRDSRPWPFSDSFRALGGEAPALESASLGEDVVGYARGARALVGLAGDILMAHWQTAVEK